MPKVVGLHVIWSSIYFLALWFDYSVLLDHHGYVVLANAFRQGKFFVSIGCIRRFLQMPMLRCMRARARFLTLILWSLQPLMVKCTSLLSTFSLLLVDGAVLLNIPGKASYFCSLHANFLANWWSSFSTSNGSRFVVGILSSAWH